MLSDIEAQNFILAATLLVAAVSMSVSWKQMRLVRKLHSDSLTPYMDIETIRSSILIQVAGYPYIEITSLEYENDVVINGSILSAMKDISVNVEIAMEIRNLASYPADAIIETSFFDHKHSSRRNVRGGEKISHLFTQNLKNISFNDLVLLYTGRAKFFVALSYTGPGISAKDFLEEEIFIPSPSKGSGVLIDYERRNIVKKKRLYN